MNSALRYEKHLCQRLGPFGIGIRHAGNLFVANGTIIDEFTPGGARSTFATGMGNPTSLAFDSTGNLYVSNGAILAGLWTASSNTHLLE